MKYSKLHRKCIIIQDEVLTLVLLRVQVFQDVTLCPCVSGPQCYFEMSETTRSVTQHHTPEDLNSQCIITQLLNPQKINPAVPTYLNSFMF